MPANSNTVTIPNGPAQVSTMAQVKQDAASGVLGHNALLQRAARLAATTYDNCGRRRAQETSVPLREDRQNYLIPPRRNRSFPLVELLR